MTKKGSTPSKGDGRDMKKVALPDPIISNGDCSRCHFNGNIISESIKCSICCKLFHALCRDKKASFTDTSICSKTFFDLYGPLSAHYGRNKSRWGQFIFICNLCHTQYPGLFPKTNATDELIDVVKLTDSPKKLPPLSLKANESQTVISGCIGGYSHSDSSISVDPDFDLSGKILALTKLNEEVLDNIKALNQFSSENASNINQELKKLLEQAKTTASYPGQSNSTLPNLNQSQNQNYSVNYDFDPDKCKPFKDFQENFLNDDLLKEVTEFLDTSNDFETIKSNNSSRDVAYYGEFKYRYGATRHDSKAIPDVLKPVLEQLSASYPNTMVNSCLITRYKDGTNTCPRHSDDEPFISPWSDIFTFSVGGERSMLFTSIKDDTTSIPLSTNSLVTFSRASQQFWKHEIPKTDLNTTRYSITFRQLAPFYLNSTLIIGDSNTQNLKFGSGRNTFGNWMPGCRVKASKIDDIPGPDDMEYPYRNLVIHCGINDIRNQNHLPISVLIEKLESKCMALSSKFSDMKIHLSLLLPTKDPGLNSVVHVFNCKIKELCNKHAKLSIISHHETLANSSGLLPHDLGRHNHDGGAMIFDTVHLGSKGLSIFCKNIKGCIIKKRSIKPQNDSYDNRNKHLDGKANAGNHYWTPNPGYRPSNRPLPFHSQPWTGDHSSNFSASSPQTFNITDFNNGYQS